jgi:hypothetical protein
MNVSSNFKPKPWMIITAVVAAVMVFTLAFFNWQRAARAEGYDWQNGAKAKYQAVQTQLSTCLDNSLQAANIAQQERASLKDVLVGTISARYQDNKGQAVNPANSQLVISAVQEAYPQVSNELFKQLMTIATGCRNQVAGAQQDLQAYAARFKTWTKTGNIFVGAIREGFPNDEFAVQGLNGKLTGNEALEFVAEPIITGAADEAAKTKQMPNQQLFPSATPTK